MKKLFFLTLALALALGLTACGPKEAPEESTPPAETTPVAESQVPETPAQEGADINLGLLNGPTGMGAAKLLSENDAGLTVNHYTVTLGSDPANDILPKLNNGDLDIAALPTNVAANLYNKTGKVQLLALNTLGVLHILENGNTVNSLADLNGKTLYAINQGTNTEYVLDYLLTQNGLDPDADVDIQWKTSEEVTSLMASGEIDLCMLPVPAATTVLMQNSDVRDAIDLSDAWTQSGANGTFTMGCVVVRTQFAQENPQAVQDFLAEYEASINYIKDNPEEGAALIEQYGIVPKAAIAQAAIPQANMIFVAGQDMKSISSYYEVLFAADPESIGGSIPDDGFYYIAE